MTPELHDITLERHVLGACLIKPSLLLATELTGEDFWSESNCRIWHALQHLQTSGTPINTVTLRSRLLDEKLLTAVGGDDYLLGLTDTIPPDHLPVERLRRLTRLRGLREAVQKTLARCEQADLDGAVTALADAHQAALQGVRNKRTQNALDLCYPLLEELESGKPSVPRIHPGYVLLEEHLGSIPQGCTVAVLASTNVGKSTFALEMLLRAAQRCVVGGYLSVEDQEAVVSSRLVGMLSGVSSRRILHHRVGEHDLRRIAAAYAELDRIKNYLHCSILQGGTDADVCAAMSELAARGVKLLVVDYLQKITSARSYANKAHEVSAAATRITSHAQRLGIACVLLSQCTRDKSRANECPSKHDAKESGDIENMVDAMIALWREYEDDFAPIWARLIKGKWGGVGQGWRLQRSDKTGRLDEVDGSDREEPPDARGDWKQRGAR